MAEERLVNLRPDHFVKGGGLIDDFDGVISDIRFVMTDYNGALPESIPAAKVSFSVDGEESDQFYSVGGKGDFIPNDTGLALVALKGKENLTDANNFGVFLDSIQQAGFPLNKMDEFHVDYLVGMGGHFLRKPVKHTGLKKKKETDREDTVLMCTKVIQLPWEAEPVKGKAKTKGKATSVDSGLADTVAGIIQSVLKANDNMMAKKDMLSALFKNKEIDATGDKKGALQLAASDDFLKGRPEWAYEDGMLLVVQ